MNENLDRVNQENERMEDEEQRFSILDSIMEIRQPTLFDSVFDCLRNWYHTECFHDCDNCDFSSSVCYRLEQAYLEIRDWKKKKMDENNISVHPLIDNSNREETI